MKFAQARELITPHIRTKMSGYAARTEEFKGIHDDQYVKAVYMENNGSKLLIITYDLCHYSYHLNKQVMDYAAKKYDIPFDNILINYSHTHAGPKITSPAEKYDPSPLEEYFIERTCTCIDRTFLNVFEGRLSIARTSGRWNINRRLETTDGYKMLPNYNAITDDELVILTVRDTENVLRTIFINYSCHPVTLSATLFLSSEFPGRVCNILESEYYGAMAFYLQGAAGNMRPFITADKGRFKPCSFDELDEFSKSIAQHVKRTIHSGEFKTIDPEFNCLKFNIDLPIDPKPISFFKEKLKQAPDCLIDRFERLIENYDSIDDSATTHCGIVKLSDALYIAYMGGEIVYEIKKVVMDVFKPAEIIFLGYHEALTYIPNDTIIDEGGYEGLDAPIYTGFRGPFKKGIDDIIANAFKKQSNKF